MLASITPLGERSRQSKYALTATFYMVASTTAALAVGTLLGAAGTFALHPVSGRVRLMLLLAIATGTLAADVWHLPSIRRQVNEDWMHAYRGWVYGAGYGLQLGTGVMTVVTTGAVYATLAAEFLSANAASGAIIGATFGGIRGVSLLAGAAIRTPRQLVSLDATLQRGERPARWVARSSHAAVVLLCLAWLVH